MNTLTIAGKQINWTCDDPTVTELAAIHIAQIENWISDSMRIKSGKISVQIPCDNFKSKRAMVHWHIAEEPSNFKDKTLTEEQCKLIWPVLEKYYKGGGFIIINHIQKTLKSS